MKQSILPVILCGGSGTRLWPLSRESYPKQFMRLFGKASLLQQTITRLQDISGIQPPLLVCNESSRFLAAEQLREIGIAASGIILEPMRRNTAPAIAAAALAATSKGEDPLLLVLPSDHVIRDAPALCAAIEAAVSAANDGSLVTFGIVPTRPEIGYGYIRVASRDGRAGPVQQFVEKPDPETAADYVRSGEYYWNSGMFLFRASRYIDELNKFNPEIVYATHSALVQANADLDFLRLEKEAYAENPDLAIDYAVMERTDRAFMVPIDAGWNDIGSWASVHEVSDKDEANNAMQGDVQLHDCNDCLVQSTGRLVTAVGMRNTVIVETADAVLVLDAERSQDIKKLVNGLAKSKRSELASHREVCRPWGTYDAIGNGHRFQVKRITVNPGAKLSIQMHHHRAEHWVVVSGTARITNGDKEYLLSENQSTYIPIGVVHSLENPGKIPLELIEIQSGAYLGEDDIVRLEDRYGRV